MANIPKSLKVNQLFQKTPKPPSRMIRILLVDDQKVVLETLKNLLEPSPDLHIVGVAQDGLTAIKLAKKLKPDVILMDMEMPTLDGMSATKIITDRDKNVKVLALSSHEENEYVSQCLANGAKGYLLKNTPPQELRRAIRSVHKGYPQIGPEVYSKIINPVVGHLYENAERQNSFSRRNIFSRINYKKGLLISGLAIAGVLSLGFISILLASARTSTVVIDQAIINAETATISAKVAGIIEKLEVKVAENVKKNQNLLRLKPSPELEKVISQLEQEIYNNQQALSSARINVNALQSNLNFKQQEYYKNLNEFEQANNKLNISEIEQEQANLESALELARSSFYDYENSYALYTKKLVNKKELRQKKIALDKAENQLNLARRKLQAAIINLRLDAAQQKTTLNAYVNWIDNFIQTTTQIRQRIQNELITINKLETEINNQKAKLAEAKRNNKPEISIKSPIAGLVYQIFIKEGENVEDSQNLLTILNCKNMWLEVVIPTEIATRIATDQPVKIKLDNQPESLSGQVTSLGILNNSIAQAITADSPNTAINISIPPKYQGENLSRIAVNVANLPQHIKDQKFCGVGNNASVTFITNVKSFSEQLQQVWQKQLVK